MSNIERSDLSEDQWRWSEPEHVSPDDPIIHGLRWREERDEARQQLRGAVVIDDAAITRAADAIGALGTDRIGAEPYAAARAILDAARGQ
jgi:hypothetical protein